VARNRKQQILGVATREFAKRGFDHVTVKELAQACDITEPAIYRHFESKEAIYIAVLDSLESRLDNEAIFQELEKQKNPEKLLKILSTHIIDFFSKNDDIYRLLLYSTLKRHGRAKRVYDIIRGRYVEFLHHQLDRLYKEKLIIKKNNEITARCFIGMVFDCAMSVTLWRGMQGKLYRPADVVANNVPIYARGLKR
jgi:AcrR family transcriptional regulator